MNYHSHFKIRMACHALKQGKLLAYPTESVYGIGCDPLNETTVMHLLSIKQRPLHKGLILIASDFAQLQPYINPSPEMLLRIMPGWPGPITWVIPAQTWVPDYLTGKHDSLAVRVSAHPLVRQLCDYYGGAIVSTSANISQQTPARSTLAVHKKFKANNIHILAGATGGHKQATAIYNALNGLCLRAS
ncbi:tRNA threonylcarbamoyladenosine biosynthesis protein RimN [Methyloprofundus sedimenti]|uniref:Threonylcarbamoyl-AMP synthase n=1 Tax=Methyloprofundus sedimenti TaxID=1420851 RepID=A0A1V8M493_9GAMM|nr:Sua5/YciO/YrdC/YwlC family protein [Methyloprofundus sedimenti]OQK16372.1 tRNA threonylcarbamoyladenosine biosynthesis protein RimN [Methyloprofundus sedimenti]